MVPPTSTRCLSRDGREKSEQGLLVSGWESPSNGSGHEESSVKGKAFSGRTHGNPLCSISAPHLDCINICAASIHSTQEQLERFSLFTVM